MRRPLLIVKACNFQSKHHKIIIDLFCIKNKETGKLDIWCVMHWNHLQVLQIWNWKAGSSGLKFSVAVLSWISFDLVTKIRNLYVECTKKSLILGSSCNNYNVRYMAAFFFKFDFGFKRKTFDNYYRTLWASK